MMKFFQRITHDRQQNVIKRTPPPRLIKLFKNVWLPQNYENIFEKHSDNSGKPDKARPSGADVKYSSDLPLSPRPADQVNAASGILKLKYELPLKKIDPLVVKEALGTAPKVKKKVIINLINHLHFIKEQVAIHIKDNTTGGEFLQQGEPGPCLDDTVSIRFVDSEVYDPQRHKPLNLIVDNRKSLLVFPIDLVSLKKESLVFRLPDMAHSYSKRRAVRHACEGVGAEIVQGKLNIRGVLEDIDPDNLRISVNSMEDINQANPLFLKLSQDNQTYFMGECRMVRSDHQGSSIILQPVHRNRPVLKKRKYPNDRVRITPPPIINFIHPLCGLSVQYKVDDITISGFSVTVSKKESLLIPGMIIPQLTLQLPGMLSHLKCAAQVIYRLQQNDDSERYGFYILDMSLNEQKRLFDAVSKAADPHVNITGRVNMDSLWELFFDSGFIYPAKYGVISPYTEILKETYRKLYEEGQDVFTHLTYQDQGQVYGHLSMVKAYENSWIIHHLAARPLRGTRTGLKTLNYFISYLDCLYRLPVSSKTMRYNFCYYRPENSFSDYYFGGVCRIFNRREICSMDLFGYMSMSVEKKADSLPDDWSIENFSKEDLLLLREYYTGIGGGMMLDAFAMECRATENSISQNVRDGGDGSHHNNIKSMYNKIGLKRESKVFSVRHNGRIKAALIVDTSDMGVNMSELLNSIKIVIIDDTLPWPVLKDAVSITGKIYESEMIMVLIFPFYYLEKHGVECKKRYNLWVLNTNLDSNEMDIIKDRAKITKRKFITEKFIKELAKNRVKRLLAKIEKTRLDKV